MILKLNFVRMDEQPPVDNGTYIVITKNGAICTAKWTYGNHWNGQFRNSVYRWCRINRDTLMLLMDVAKKVEDGE